MPPRQIENVSGESSAEQTQQRFDVLLIQPDAPLAGQLARAIGNATRLIRTLRELYETNLNQVSVVLCALELPDGTGMDAIAYLRGMKPEVRTILIGSDQDARIVGDAVACGAVEFLPVENRSPDELHAEIQQTLSVHQRQTLQGQHQIALRRLIARLSHRNFELEQSVLQLRELVNTDELTGLCNRRGLNGMLRRIWDEAVRHDRPLACTMLDLVAFKKINDSFGHTHGDSVLRLVGRILQANCRQVDVAARYGGDEFCVLMPDTLPHEAVGVARRVQSEFEIATRSATGSVGAQGLSIGISHVDLSRPVNAEQLLTHADEAMCTAKMNSRGGIAVRGPRGMLAGEIVG